MIQRLVCYVGTRKGWVINKNNCV